MLTSDDMNRHCFDSNSRIPVRKDSHGPSGGRLSLVLMSLEDCCDAIQLLEG